MIAGNEIFAGLPLSVPLRITMTGEAPISRTYWFTSTFTSGRQSINGLFVAYAKAQHALHPDPEQGVVCLEWLLVSL